MLRNWPQTRYWLVLTVSLCLAVLTVPSGLAMGGPDGFVGWIAFAAVLASPMAIWWTRWGKAATLIQNVYLLLLVIAAVSAALIAFLTT